MKSFRLTFLLLSLTIVAKAQVELSKKGQTAIVTYEKYFEENKDVHLKEFLELVSMPTVSSLQANRPDIDKAAAWIVKKLQAIGMTTAQVMQTDGPPVVYGSWEGAKGKPTVLIYAHYDVQPVKESEWTIPPFEPKVVDGKIFGRGTSDDKCGVMIPIWAVEAILKKDKALPVNVKFLFEGEEEVGGPNLHKFMINNKELLKADFALNADGGQYSESIPSICMAFRGSAQLEFNVKTANYDAHSGSFGGKTANAVKATSEIIASFYNKNGSVAVAGFYDNVPAITAAEREMIAKVPYDAAADMKELGSTADVGDTNYTALEKLWYRPTLEIVGMQGGYTAVEGFNNIIPGSATARITCRLVGSQKGDEVIQAIVKHIGKNTPAGATVTYKFRPGWAHPIKFPSDNKAYNYVANALTTVFGRPPLQTGEGGSVGSLVDIKEALGLDAYSFGVAIPDERYHAANEFLRLSSIRKGQMLYCNYFMYVGEQEDKAKK